MAMLTYLEAIRQAMEEEMVRDPRVFEEGRNVRMGISLSF